MKYKAYFMMEAGPHPDLNIIPPLSKKCLDLMGSDYSDPMRSWKYDLYTRIVQPTIASDIDTDFDTNAHIPDPIGLANRLKDFVETWDPTRTIDGAETLSRTLNDSFKIFLRDQANLIIPGIVTSRFAIPGEKENAEKAYQDLLLLEITYFITRTIENEHGQEADHLRAWVARKQPQLIPSFQKLWFNKIRAALFGERQFEVSQSS